MLHHLRTFFIDACDRGDLSVAPPPQSDDSPQAQFAAWLRRQYLAYTGALLGLVGARGANARTQVRGAGAAGQRLGGATAALATAAARCGCRRL